MKIPDTSKYLIKKSNVFLSIGSYEICCVLFDLIRVSMSDGNTYPFLKKEQTQYLCRLLQTSTLSKSLQRCSLSAAAYHDTPHLSISACLPAALTLYFLPAATPVTRDSVRYDKDKLPSRERFAISAHRSLPCTSKPTQHMIITPSLTTILIFLCFLELYRDALIDGLRVFIATLFSLNSLVVEHAFIFGSIHQLVIMVTSCTLKSAMFPPEVLYRRCVVQYMS